VTTVKPVPSRYRVVYQVFVDRYDPGELAVPARPERSEDEGTVRRSFGAPPEGGLDLQGGTLLGIARRARHVAAFADALYLTPISQAPSNHKYDVSDYDVVDAHFGGEAALETLVATTRAQGLGLFFDLVLNHVGDRHEWVTNPLYADRLRGTTWRGHAHLRELDLRSPRVRTELLVAVARAIARGADGLRLDCANDLGPLFCAEVARTIAEAGGRGGAIGEVMAWPGELLGDGALDGVMGYWPRAALLSALEDPARAPVAAEALWRLVRAVDHQHLLRSWTVLSSHDTPRLSDQVGFDERKAQLLLALQFAYPGTPMIYYGEEIGLRGGADPGCRGAMIWDEASWDRARFDAVRRLCALRKLPALHDGGYTRLPIAAPHLAFARGHHRDRLVCLASFSPQLCDAHLLLPLDGFFDALPLEDLLSGERFPIDAGAVRVPMAPYQARYLVPRDDAQSGYRFWKT
jgi:glycosidase